MADNFYADQKIELSIQMDNTVAGWMFGRMKDTKVSSIPISKNSTLLTVEGASINVPFGHAWVPIKEIPTGKPSWTTSKFGTSTERHACHLPTLRFTMT